MTDRIANLWGKRTPFGPGEEWPVRVDQILEEGISEDDVDRWVQTASILHSNGDALDIAVRADASSVYAEELSTESTRAELTRRTSLVGKPTTPKTD
jgi:hypothetical protein